MEIPRGKGYFPLYKVGGFSLQNTGGSFSFQTAKSELFYLSTDFSSFLLQCFALIVTKTRKDSFSIECYAYFLIALSTTIGLCCNKNKLMDKIAKLNQSRCCLIGGIWMMIGGGFDI